MLRNFKVTFPNFCVLQIISYLVHRGNK